MNAKDYHAATKHSYKSVRTSPHHLDWSTQPSQFKVYSDTASIPMKGLKDEDFLYYLGGVTAYKQYPGIEYALRVNPSAGALYPNELYFQARGVDGREDGLYHYEPVTSELKLLSRLEDAGLEPFFGTGEFTGYIFLTSAIYFRSAWKYRDRAFRYCLLDSGHLLGSIEAACVVYGKCYQMRFGFEKAELNKLFGFGAEEFFVGAILVGHGESNEVKRFHKVLKNHHTSEYSERNEMIESVYRETLRETGGVSKEGRFDMELDQSRLKVAILKRRSIRGFKGGVLPKSKYDFIQRYVGQVLSADMDEPLQIYTVAHHISDMQSGIYKDGQLVKAGDFRKKATYLCLEQALGGDSGFTVFMLGDTKNYQALYQKAGLIGQRYYVAATYIGAGCSGIGAYYDDEVNAFLGTEGAVLYALAIGI